MIGALKRLRLVTGLKWMMTLFIVAIAAVILEWCKGRVAICQLVSVIMTSDGKQFTVVTGATTVTMPDHTCTLSENFQNQYQLHHHHLWSLQEP